MSKLYEILESAKSDLQDWIDNNPNDDDCQDEIFEIADSSVPVYTGDLLNLACENTSFAVDTPELGPAFDGTPTPINIIAANVFEYIMQELYEYFELHKDDYLEDEE